MAATPRTASRFLIDPSVTFHLVNDGIEAALEQVRSEPTARVTHLTYARRSSARSKGLRRKTEHGMYTGPVYSVVPIPNPGREPTRRQCRLAHSLGAATANVA